MRGKIVVALTALAIIGAAALDVISPPEVRPPAASVVTTRAGVLACPIATTGRGNAYLHLANVGGAEAKIRITLFPVRGKRVVISDQLAAHAARTFVLHTRMSGPSSALVEHAGGTVVASHSLWMPPERGLASGGAAGACMPSGTSVVSVAPTRTFGADTNLTLFNPGAADAVVSVVLLMRDRRAAPVRLTRRIVPAHGRREFQLGSFAFEEREVIALVDASSGRVVPEALVSSPARGIELVGAQPAANELVLAYGQGGRTATRSFAAVGDEDTGVTVRTAGPEGFTGEPVTSAIVPSTLSRGAGPPGDDSSAVVIERTSGSPIAGGAWWLHERPAGTDIAALEGLAPFTRWAATLGSVVDRSATVALLVNPGEQAATTEVVARGPSGEQRSTVEIPPGAVHRLVVAQGKGTFSVVVDADRPITLSLVQNTIAFRGSVQAFDIPGLPLRPPLPVAARPDPRAGIPARRMPTVVSPTRR